LHLSSQE